MNLHRNRLLQGQQSHRSRPTSPTTVVRKDDRVLYIRGLFAPPKEQEPDTFRKTQESEEWRQLFSIGLLLSFGLIVGIISVVGDYGLWSRGQMTDRKVQLEEEISELRHQKAQLRQEIVALRESPAYLEQVARQELGLVGKKDHIYLVFP